MKWIKFLTDKLNKFFLFLLTPLGVVYRFFMWVRNLCYDTGFFPSQKLSCKVVSVGNITLGGTGKTPAVITLVKYFQKQGMTVAVLSRGYGRKTKKTVIVGNGIDIQPNWQDVGDEAFFIAHSLRSVPVVVDENRLRGGNFLIKNYNPDIIIMDDAFQHRKIKRDIDIVLLNCLESRNTYRLIPQGKLREPLAQLKRAHVVIFTKANLGNFPEDIHIPKYTRASLHKAEIEAETYLLDKDKTEIPVHDFHNKKCVLVSGVGSPEGVYRTAKAIKLNIVVHLRFRDHHIYDQKDCNKINNALRENNGDFILTTEKDMVKLCPVSGGENAFNLAAEIYSLPVKFVFEDKTLDEISNQLR